MKIRQNHERFGKHAKRNFLYNHANKFAQWGSNLKISRKGFSSLISPFISAHFNSMDICCHRGALDMAV